MKLLKILTFGQQLNIGGGKNKMFLLRSTNQFVTYLATWDLVNDKQDGVSKAAMQQRNFMKR